MTIIIISYKPVFIFAKGETQRNSQAFATYQEAWDSAEARFQRWSMPTGYYVEESTDPVNFQYKDGVDKIL
tara:strand:+ start:1200 stop:1412 length:213 start_codon:yes stop_codon:yes gene_type:complete